MSSPFERVGKIQLENPSFTEGLKYWRTSKGNPSVQKEKITPKSTNSSFSTPAPFQFQNSYWIGSDLTNSNRMKQKRPINESNEDSSLSCSYQFIDFTEDWKKIQIFDENNINVNDISKFFGKIDNEEILIEVSAELRRPNLNSFRNSGSKCSTRNHFCDVTFNDHVWVEVFFYTAQSHFDYTDFFTNQKVRFDFAEREKDEKKFNDDDDNDDDDQFKVIPHMNENEKKIQINRKKISSLRSMKEDFDFWNERKIKGIIPKRTRGIKLQICSQQRAGENNEGMADDVTASLYLLPDQYRAINSKYQCSITKEPMMRLIEYGKYLIVWETNANLNTISCKWGWRSDRLLFSEIVQTTQVDDCHFVHKCSIHFENFDDHDDDDDQKLAENFDNRSNLNNNPLLDNDNFNHRNNNKNIDEEADEEVDGEFDDDNLTDDRDKFAQPERENGFYYSISCGDIKTATIFHRIIPPPIPITSSLALDKIKFENLKVAIVSDNQYGSQIMRHVITDITSHRPHFIMMGGDSVDHGAIIEEWFRYFWQPLQIENLAQKIPIVLTRGNHDGESAVAHAFTSPIHNQDWYSFMSLSTFFIVLDSNADNVIAPKQTEWLKRTMESSSFQDALFRVVLFHLPPFTELWSIKEKYNGEEFVREDWVPLFEKYQVDLVITGHTHAYLRGSRNGVVYTIVGGAGGDIDLDHVYDWKMFEVTKKEFHFVMMEVKHCFLNWNVFNPHDSLIDSLVLPSKHPLCSPFVQPL